MQISRFGALLCLHQNTLLREFGLMPGYAILQYSSLEAMNVSPLGPGGDEEHSDGWFQTREVFFLSQQV